MLVKYLAPYKNRIYKDDEGMNNILIRVAEMGDSGVNVSLFSRDRPSTFSRDRPSVFRRDKPSVLWDVRCYVCGEEQGLTQLPVYRYTAPFSCDD